MYLVLVKKHSNAKSMKVWEGFKVQETNEDVEACRDVMLWTVFRTRKLEALECLFQSLECSARSIQCVSNGTPLS